MMERLRKRKFWQSILLFAYSSLAASGVFAQENDREKIEELKTLNRVVFIDRNAKRVTAPISCINFSAFQEGLARVLATEEAQDSVISLREGFIDKKGNWAVRPRKWEYRHAHKFCEGLAVRSYRVAEDELASDVFRFAYIDKSGKFAIRPPARQLSTYELQVVGAAFDFSEGIALLRWDLLRRAGRSYPFQRYVEEQRYSFVDKEGKFILDLSQDMKAIEPDQDDQDYWQSVEAYNQEAYERKRKGSSFSNGLALIEYKGKLGFIRKDGSWLGPTNDAALPFSEGLAYIRNGEEAAFIDTNGKLAFKLPAIYDTYGASFHEGLCRQRSKWNKIGSPAEAVLRYIDRKGNTVFSLNEGKQKSFIHYAGDFSCGLALLRQGDKYGYIDKKGAWKIPPRFERAEPFHEGIARVSLDQYHHQYIDTDGKLVFDAGVKEGSFFAEGLMGVWVR